MPFTDIEEFYTADLDNEEAHGDFIVGLCNEEILGKKTGSCFVIARPNTHPADIPHLKAKITPDGVQIVSPVHTKTYLTHSSAWLKVIQEHQKDFQAEKLVTTLTGMVTRLKKNNRTKTTFISVKDIGFELSNEHFSVGVAEGELQMLPIPYTYELKIGDDTKKVTEVICIWRAFIVGTEQDIEEESSNNKSDYEMLLGLMKKSKIGR